MGFSWRSIHPESFHIELLSGCRLSRVFGKQHVPGNILKKKLDHIGTTDKL